MKTHAFTCAACHKPQTVEWRYRRRRFCSAQCARAFTPKAVADPIDRFHRHVEKTEGCWLWTGAKNALGYGKLHIKKDGKDRAIDAHRFSWMCANGPIPEGLFVLHSCDTPSCVNPAHLSVGTAADNARDMVTRGRSARGERHSQASLSDVVVAAMLADYRAGMSLMEVARKHGATASSAYWRIHNSPYGIRPDERRPGLRGGPRRLKRAV
jgi:hypothetical protein